MDDQEKKIKASSVAAFLFLPQFRLSFQQLSFIVPVFIRTIASMFEQAGLLPQGHPATRYGVEGVKKYKFKELLGEAFYTLRTTKATPYQWSLFVAVVMMIVFTILSAITTLMHMASVAITPANAQIFDHPVGDTSMSTVPKAPSGVMFDTSVPATGAHADYGIMILDKMLRQGALGQGGPIQNALGSLMQIYNTGVLVIAGVMLFWAVLAVVVDTAKTGQIGGGRHNMVWAPIRIVFALALLIPLGSSGFSSGQYAVMKLAEWGSNFGTRAWGAYVSKVAQDSNMLASYKFDAPSDLINQYLRMWTCRVASNAYERDAVLYVNADQLIKTSSIPLDSQGMQGFSFTNGLAENKCGAVRYLSTSDPSFILAEQQGDETTKRVAKYKKEMIAAYSVLFAVNGNPDAGLLTPKTKELACAWASNYFNEKYLTPDCGAIVKGACGNVGVPDGTCVTELASIFISNVKGVQDKAEGDLAAYLKSPDFIKAVTDKGWAGMGMWYHRIEQTNRAAASMRQAPVTISQGSGYNIKEDLTEGVVSWDFMKYAANMFTGGGKTNKVSEVITAQYHWWPVVGKPAVSKAAKSAGYKTDEIQDVSGKTTAMAMKDAVDADSAMGVANSLFGALMPAGNHPLVLRALTSESDRKELYPLALLAATGQSLLNWSVLMYTISSIVPPLLNLIFPTIGVGTAAGLSSLFKLIATLAGTIFMAGILLTFWVPLLPFIRALHAVLTWMISVFEAVMMVPIAALAHLTTEGEGIAGGAKNVWILWLNVIMRPILTVIGFVAAIIVFNTFVVYFHDSYLRTIAGGLVKESSVQSVIGAVVYTVIYVGIIYTVANSTFKLLDLIPNAMMRWMGGQADQSFDQDHTGLVQAAGQQMMGISNSVSGQVRPQNKNDDKEQKRIAGLAAQNTEAEHAKNFPKDTGSDGGGGGAGGGGSGLDSSSGRGGGPIDFGGGGGGTGSQASSQANNTPVDFDVGGGSTPVDLDVTKSSQADDPANNVAKDTGGRQPTDIEGEFKVVPNEPDDPKDKK